METCIAGDLFFRTEGGMPIYYLTFIGAGGGAGGPDGNFLCPENFGGISTTGTCVGVFLCKCLKKKKGLRFIFWLDFKISSQANLGVVTTSLKKIKESKKQTPA